MMPIYGSSKSCPEVWFSVQPQENTSQGPSGDFGCLYDESGVYPDPEKVDAVHALPTTTNITKLQEFPGTVTYLNPFIPGLSTLTTPLHELLMKDAEFSWDTSYQTAFQHVKDAINPNVISLRQNMLVDTKTSFHALLSTSSGPRTT